MTKYVSALATLKDVGTFSMAGRIRLEFYGMRHEGLVAKLDRWLSRYYASFIDEVENEDVQTSDVAASRVRASG